MTSTTGSTEAAQWLARADAAAGDKHVPVEQVIALYQKALTLDATLVEGWARLPRIRARNVESGSTDSAKTMARWSRLPRALGIAPQGPRKAP
jgi:hypothetical protein